MLSFRKLLRKKSALQQSVCFSCIIYNIFFRFCFFWCILFHNKKKKKKKKKLRSSNKLTNKLLKKIIVFDIWNDIILFFRYINMSNSSDDGAWMLPAAAACVPFGMFLVGHQRGLTIKMFNFAYQRFGAIGLVGLPVVTLTIEKSVYDSVNAYQGKDPNEKPKGSGSGFPSGGHMLPSLSLVSVNKNGAFYRAPQQG